ncbi:MAG: pyridoxamine 5'-phosphate oxidase family protein [Pseudomonadota bacterium]
MSDRISDIAFTDAVKEQQNKRGSRDGYSSGEDWLDRVTPELSKFIAARTSFYFATVSETGYPYIQHRGGPPGFLKVLDDRTLGFADFAGNRQYISLGNLDGSDRANLFLMDYANSQRIKIWGRAKVIEDDPDLLQRLVVQGYRARPERAIVIRVEAWDVNCPQHIPALHDEATIRLVTQKLSQRIAALEAENAELKQWIGKE